MAPGCNLLYPYAMSSPAAILFQAHLGSSQQLPFRALGRTQKQNGSKQTSFLCVTASLLAKPISDGTKSEQHTFKVLSGASYLWIVMKKKRALLGSLHNYLTKGFNTKVWGEAHKNNIRKLASTSTLPTQAARHKHSLRLQYPRLKERELGTQHSINVVSYELAFNTSFQLLPFAKQPASWKRCFDSSSWKGD